MKTSLDDPILFAEKISLAETKLEALAREITEIGQPAGNSLRKRLDALRIEEHALRRNFTESQQSGSAEPHRMEQIELLLEHIEREEASLAHEADFLHQSPPSSVTLAAEAGMRFFDAVGRGMKRVLKGHHPLGSSVFVNTSYETLVNRHGLRKDDGNTPSPPGNPKNDR